MSVIKESVDDKIKKREVVGLLTVTTTYFMGVDGPLLGELGWFGEVDEEEDMFCVILSKAKSEIF